MPAHHADTLRYQKLWMGIKEFYMSQITISFYDVNNDTTYQMHDTLSFTKTRKIATRINDITNKKSPCLSEVRMHMVDKNSAVIITSVGRKTLAPCNKCAGGSLKALRPTDQMRACIGRMSRGLCQDKLVLSTFGPILWPENYGKQR